MNKFNFLVGILVTASIMVTVSAEVLTLNPGATSNTGINISTGAKAIIEGPAIDLTTIGSGLRKKVVILPVKVYVAQLLVADPSQHVKTEDGALESIKQQTAVAIHFSFLRDVPVETVVTSYLDGFSANSIDTGAPEIVQFMELVNRAGDAKRGDTLTIVVAKNDDGSQTLAYEILRSRSTAPPLAVMRGSELLMYKIMALWLGKTNDAGLATLKAELLR